MSVWYDMDGNLLGRGVAGAVAFGQRYPDVESRRVAVTDLPDGRWVSTVLLGLHGDGPPLVFETMVFPRRETEAERAQDWRSGGRSAWLEIHVERYSTRAEAEAGHARIVAECLAGEHGRLDTPPAAGSTP